MAARAWKAALVAAPPSRRYRLSVSSLPSSRLNSPSGLSLLLRPSSVSSASASSHASAPSSFASSPPSVPTLASASAVSLDSRRCLARVSVSSCRNSVPTFSQVDSSPFALSPLFSRIPASSLACAPRAPLRLCSRADFSSASGDSASDGAGRTSSSSRSSHHSSSRTHRSSQHRRPSSGGSGSSASFIKSVLAQVKQDMERNHELKKAMEDLKASSLSQKSEKLSSRVQEAAATASALASQVANQTQTLWGDAATQASRMQQLLKDKAFTPIQEATEQNAALKGVAQAVGRARQRLNHALSKVASATEIFRDDVDDAEKKAAKWRQDMAVKRFKEQEARKREQELAQRPSDSEADGADEGAKKPQGAGEREGGERRTEEEEPREDALVLSQRTSWDRFSTKFKEMSFLQNFFENPLVAQLFGETEIAASIREMKILDPKFKLADMHNMMERVIAAHIVQAFLLGDEGTLAVHCAEGAFAAMRASIIERRAQKVRLDSEILQLGNVELVGARRSLTPPICATQNFSADECPWFVYTFTCQQVNCLRSEVDGRVVEGREDDIRRVVYSIAVSKHPKPETEGLLYPWMIREIAIIGSEAVW
ncbi:putative mitochondrial import inner membrane translocase TIM44 [Toxoplasma gondii VAND]|uniref:Putative mitochondrial import inner membrane translocase TIM44 n=1 Tax=Toxoplasma gondii VAND TaxID=933077 RepID=A0A086QJZ8_TOXGO|nr:putative mitochondrial import inner membrane translocase TIM44 [Toxoplasma gondii VAND]